MLTGEWSTWGMEPPYAQILLWYNRWAIGSVRPSLATSNSYPMRNKGSQWTSAEYNKGAALRLDTHNVDFMPGGRVWVTNYTRPSLAI